MTPETHEPTERANPPVTAAACTCPREWKSLGRLYGVGMGEGWVRLNDDPACLLHGTQADD
jgi:hypothetical protein